MDVKQNARPARHDDPTVPSTPASGRESRRPIVGYVKRVVAAALTLRPQGGPRLCSARYVFPRPLAMSVSKPPPPGIYVPAILFFKENEDIDEEAQKLHIVKLAQVQPLEFLLRDRTLALTAAPNAPICRDPSTGSSSRDRTAKRSIFQAKSGSASFV